MKRILPALLLLAATARADTLRVPQDFPSIQAAVDAALQGDMVLVAAGSYEETVNIGAKLDVTLRGQGQVFLRGGDVDTAVVTVSNGVGVVVERLRFVQPAFAGVHVDDSSHTRVSRCRVEDSEGMGLFVNISPSTLLERCIVQRATGNSINVTSSDGTQLYRCRVEDGGATGIILSGCDGGRIDRCAILRTQFYAMVVGFPGAATGNTVQRNLVVDGGFGALDLNAGGSTARDNLFVRPGQVGLRVEGVAEGSVIADNRIVQPEGSGIELEVAGLVARRNRIVKPGGSGLQAEADGVSLLDNIVLKAGGDGLQLLDAVGSGSVLGNSVRLAAGHGVAVDSVGVHLQDNRALGSGLDGFHLTEGGNTLVHNLAKGSGEFDLRDDALIANFLLDNSFATVAP